MILRSLDLEALKATPVTREPFEYLVVPGFVRAQAREKINADYPKIAEGEFSGRAAFVWAGVPRIPRGIGERRVP